MSSPEPYIRQKKEVIFIGNKRWGVFLRIFDLWVRLFFLSSKFAVTAPRGLVFFQGLEDGLSS
ncbi:MAG: hypothetical protein D6681_13890 [Calditrichaeota bacterium]|nr:MAG: hypothetical protein D6681_13890 [Calditrichota bacterium]